jgi:hypothetical protein
MAATPVTAPVIVFLNPQNEFGGTFAVMETFAR